MIKNNHYKEGDLLSKLSYYDNMKRNINMKREILFRAKLINRKWIEGYYYKMSETTYAIKADYEMHPVPVHHYILHETMTDWGLPNQMLRYEVEGDTVCQYTGLKDMTGKRIYEGDIISYLDSEKEYCARVVFEEGQFKCDWNNNFFRRDLYYWEDIKVVGNIYDNPEWLGELGK